MTDLKEDPELNNSDDHGTGAEDAYDQLAVEAFDFDAAQFDLDDYSEVIDDE